MRIEKLNDNQIRCTLTREDLDSREINLIELAYGGEKAKSLFREMMQQAAYQCGFEPNDQPIMIEAIPMSSDSIILIITKVEDPEELDTRFAKFTPMDDTAAEAKNTLSSLKLEGADDILNLVKKLREAHKNIVQKADTASKEEAAQEEASQDGPIPNVTKLYRFSSLDDVIRAAKVLGSSYHGENSLYKHPVNGEYRLIMSSSSHTPEEFNRICNTISEYAGTMKYSVGAAAYLSEHGTVIVPHQAIQQLANIH